MSENKKLERSRKNRVIAGVCAGLADYFNIDIALVRALFIVAAICASFGFWMYVILWVVVPEEIVPEIDNAGIDDTIDISPKKERKPVSGAMIGGLILILIGFIFLVENFTSIRWLWKLWPVILIVIGVGILINSQKNNSNEQ